MATGGAPPATSEASAAPATESSQPAASSETTEQSKPSEESMETTQVNNTNCEYNILQPYDQCWLHVDTRGLRRAGSVRPARLVPVPAGTGFRD